MRIRNKLKEENGSAMIETCIWVLVCVILLSIFLQTVSVLVYKYKMGTVADKICEVISAEGRYDKEVQDIVSDYIESSNLKNATVSLNGTEYIRGTDRIQLNDNIVVTITSTYKIGFHAASVSINMQNVSQTRSGVYWK